MAKFSKQHYQAIASILIYAKGCAECHTPNETIAHIAHDLAIEFERDNKRFNLEHFLAVVRGERAVNSRPPRA